MSEKPRWPMPGRHKARVDDDGTFRFGKHDGEHVSQIPQDYLEWMVEVNHAAVKVAQAELERRRVEERLK